jgi:predicted GNAT family N-acyltransferase
MECFIATTQKHFYDQVIVRKEVFIIEQQVPINEEFDIHDCEAIQFIAYDNEKAIGAARIRLLPDKVKVERVCVLKEYRKYGVGKLMMTTIEDYTKEHTTLKKLGLNAQLTALPFYQKLGYQEYGDIFLDANIEHKSMIKEI